MYNLNPATRWKGTKILKDLMHAQAHAWMIVHIPNCYSQTNRHSTIDPYTIMLYRLQIGIMTYIKMTLWYSMMADLTVVPLPISFSVLVTWLMTSQLKTGKTNLLVKHGWPHNVKIITQRSRFIEKKQQVKNKLNSCEGEWMVMRKSIWFIAEDEELINGEYLI